MHFFDSSKKGQKFRYRAKQKLPLTPIKQPRSRTAEPAGRKPEKTRPTLRPGTKDPLRFDGLFDEKKIEYGYPSSSRAKSQQTPRAAEPTGRTPEELGAWGHDLLKKTEDCYPSASYGKQVLPVARHDPAFASCSQPQDHQVESDLLHPHTESNDYICVLPPNKTIMVQTRLYYGRISNRPEDIEYWKPGFVIPDNMERDLFGRHSKQSDAYLLIFSDERGRLTCQATEKKGKEWQQTLDLHSDETIKLQTRLKSGAISFEGKDRVLYSPGFRLPPVLVCKLKKEFWATRNAELFVISDSKGNIRGLVRGDKINMVFRFFNEGFVKLDRLRQTLLF